MVRARSDAPRAGGTGETRRRAAEPDGANRATGPRARNDDAAACGQGTRSRADRSRVPLDRSRGAGESDSPPGCADLICLVVSCARYSRRIGPRTTSKMSFTEHSRSPPPGPRSAAARAAALDTRGPWRRRSASLSANTRSRGRRSARLRQPFRRSGDAVELVAAAPQARTGVEVDARSAAARAPTDASRKSRMSSDRPRWGRSRLCRARFGLRGRSPIRSPSALSAVARVAATTSFGNGLPQ